MHSPPRSPKRPHQNGASPGNNNGHADADPQFSGDDIEAVPRSLRGREAIVVDGLTKTFTAWGKADVTAVNGVSLKMYPGEITAVLGERTRDREILFLRRRFERSDTGHNGAGKTTLFNMLTGMTSVTSGRAEIFG